MIAIVASLESELPAGEQVPPHFQVFLLGVGLVQAALNTTKIISTYRPERIICVGTCGAVRPDLHVGDIVIGSTAVHYGLDLRRFGLPRGATRDRLGLEIAALPLVQPLEDTDPHCHGRTIHRGITIGSADRFLVASDRSEMPWIESELRVEAVDMESYAVASAAHAAAVPVSVIRVVSDTSTGKRPSSFGSFLSRSSGDLVDFIAHCTFPSEKSPTIL